MSYRGPVVGRLTTWPGSIGHLKNPTECLWRWEHARNLLIQAASTFTWVDQKVLKLVAFLHNYTTELHQTYTEYVTTISWFVNVVRMTHYARGYMTSSFDDVMQQWPGVKNVRNCLFPAKCNYQYLCLIWPLFFRNYYGLDEASLGPDTL